MVVAAEVFAKVWHQPRLFICRSHRLMDGKLVCAVVYAGFYVDFLPDLSFNVFNRNVQKQMKPDPKFFDRVIKTATAVADKVKARYGV